MAKRLFYRCPIEALYMANNFGVILTAVQPDRRLTQVKDWCVVNGKYKDAFFIEFGVRTDLRRGNTWSAISGVHEFEAHPDSMGIFEPRVGDKVAETRHPKRSFTVVPDGENRSPWDIALSGAIEFVAKGELEIERRNGKPFIWPEVE